MGLHSDTPEYPIGEYKQEQRQYGEGMPDAWRSLPNSVERIRFLMGVVTYYHKKNTVGPEYFWAVYEIENTPFTWIEALITQLDTVTYAAKELAAAASVVYMAYEIPGNEQWIPGAHESLYDANGKGSDVWDVGNPLPQHTAADTDDS